MHIEGGTAIAYKRDIENAPDPEGRRQEIEARLQAISSPFRNAHAFGIEEMIDPRDTRPLLVDFIDDAWKVVQTQLGPGSGPSPHFSPGAVMIAEDFGPVRVLATESIAGPTVEGACACTGPKDPRGHGQRSLQPARSLASRSTS